MMELKCTNPNGAIVLASKINHVELLFLKNCKIAFRNQSYKKMLRLPEKQDCP